MATLAEQRWQSLNERQRCYLKALYAEDQAAEADISDRRKRWMQVPPASEWRQILFSVDAPRELIGYTSAQERIRFAGVHDPGAGSTLAALDRRGLLEVLPGHYRLMGSLVPCVRVRLTRAGRAAARAGLGVTTPARPPKGLLKRWLWWRLVAIAAANEAGVHADELGYRGEWWVYLDERGRGYVEQRPDRPSGQGRWAYYLTETGAAHITAHRATYERLYPDIDTGFWEQRNEESR